MQVNKFQTLDDILEYHLKGLTNKQIEDVTNFSSRQITGFLNRKGLKANKYEIINVSDEFKQILIGSYLGDGCFTKIEDLGINSRFSIAHSIKQKAYFKLKWDYFNEHKLAGKIAENRVFSDRYKEGYYDEIRFKSKTHPIFTEIREKGYSETKKKLNIELVKDINNLGLAIWYMDDGAVNLSSCNIACDKFTELEKYMLRDLISEKFKIELNVTASTLYVPQKQFSEFKELVKPFVIESMLYKLEPYNIKGSV